MSDLAGIGIAALTLVGGIYILAWCVGWLIESIGEMFRESRWW